eukprot:m.1618365 g.1618365  ORF g.1618365 m.1618365 type:complete len:144 (+) comp25377_c0_seq9:2796-3227(+)
MNLLTEHAMLLRITGLMIRTATNTPVQNPLFSGEDGTLSMSVLHHAPDEFDGGVVKSATHAVDIVDEVATNITVVHVDKLQMGLGGVDSWGSSPLDQYRIPLRSSRYESNKARMLAHHVNTVERTVPLPSMSIRVMRVNIHTS